MRINVYEIDAENLSNRKKFDKYIKTKKIYLLDRKIGFFVDDKFEMSIRMCDIGYTHKTDMKLYDVYKQDGFVVLIVYAKHGAQFISVLRDDVPIFMYARITPQFGTYIYATFGMKFAEFFTKGEYNWCTYLYKGTSESYWELKFKDDSTTVDALNIY